METEQIITAFIRKAAPTATPGTNGFARHTLTTLSRFLNVTPSEISELCRSKLLIAAEAWPGAPSLTFSNIHLFEMRQQIARCHALDAVELAGSQINATELSQIIELSWQKRKANVVELTSKQKLIEFSRN